MAGTGWHILAPRTCPTLLLARRTPAWGTLQPSVAPCPRRTCNRDGSHSECSSQASLYCRPLAAQADVTGSSQGPSELLTGLPSPRAPMATSVPVPASGCGALQVMRTKAAAQVRARRSSAALRCLVGRGGAGCSGLGWRQVWVYLAMQSGAVDDLASRRTVRKPEGPYHVR